MSQDEELKQLHIWKDLAISKQILMNEAASILKLSDDFGADELREALQTAVDRSNNADSNIAEAKNKASEEVGAMQAEVKKMEKSLKDAIAAREAAESEKSAAEHSVSAGRKDNAEALQKAKKQVEEKQRELKAINAALGDSPDNIVKKLKTLKKQKLDEGNARKVAEDANRKLKKENKDQKAELDALAELKKDGATLLAAYRELYEWAQASKHDEETAAPKADAKLLTRIETITAGADEEDKKDA